MGLVLQMHNKKMFDIGNEGQSDGAQQPSPFLRY